MSADFHCWDPVLKLQPSDPVLIPPQVGHPFRQEVGR